MSDENISQKPQYRMFKISWAERGIALFADNVTVQFDGEVFRVSFYQVNPPIRISDSKEPADQSENEEIETVQATPIANLIIPKKLFEKTINLFQQQFDLAANITDHASAPDH